MSIPDWIFRRKKPPTIFLGDVQMHLDWNVLSALCEGFAYTWNGQPSPKVLREHFSNALGLPVYEAGICPPAGNLLFHLAITDIHHGHVNAYRFGDYWIPVVLRPSVTVQGYLVDIETGNVLAEGQQTQKPGWIRYRNPPLVAWSLLTQSDAAGAALDPPMCETTAIKLLLKLKKTAEENVKRGWTATALSS